LELNLYIEAYAFNQKESMKRQIIGGFYSAYFNLKGQKGLSGSDLTKVLKKIDNENDEMTADEIFEVFQNLC
jgi:hypothetical protein